MDTYDMSEFQMIRPVYYERHDAGGWRSEEFEARSVELCQRGSDHYLLYWYDPLPGGYGDRRCEGILHINESEAKKDDIQLSNLYFDSKVKPLINMDLHQKQLTLCFLSAAYCQDRVCFAWCACGYDEGRYEGCIEYTRDAMDYMTEEKLTAALKKVIPAGTVIPAFSLSKKRKKRHI